jgi:hypothetical protein
VELTLGDLLFMSPDLTDYFAYAGSRTAPGCDESVAWVVFARPLPISSRFVSAYYLLRGMLPPLITSLPLQLLPFRTQLTTDHKPMANNYRASQALGSRVVFRNV